MQMGLSHPKFFHLHISEDREAFYKLLRDHSPTVFDYINLQVQEWLKVRQPARKFNAADLSLESEKVFDGMPRELYGVWVYYPWSNRLVHLLPEEMFVEVRTSRNRNKITAGEQAILREKKIAVIGLSVGQSVAYTLAQERICGELRLADYDTLELNNLNRIRSGLHNIGLLKVIGIARDISEIDPFLKVRCFPSGINDGNMDEFFAGNGKVDLLIEESDSFDIKIVSRFKARELGIPVLMEASDRCMVDVERFDLEPSRSILHGLVEHLSPESLKKLKTTEDKIPPMLDVLGLDSTSVRLRASMVEIEQTINTWPQLASAVTMGGGITADVARRILLGLFNDSGRYYVDVEQIIGPHPTESTITKQETTVSVASDFSYHANEKIRHGKSQVTDTVVRELVESGIMAPSAGNLQPWYWVQDGEVIQLWHDVARTACWSDPGHRIADMGLGAAIENLRLTALVKFGLQAHLDIPPREAPSSLKALITFTSSEQQAAENEKVLFEAISLRCSNRKKGNRKPLSTETESALLSVCTDDFKLRFVNDEDGLQELGNAIAEVERYRFLHKEGHADFFGKEMRWTPAEIKGKADGIDVDTLELSVLDLTGMKVLKDPQVAANVSAWNGGKALTRITSALVRSSSSLVLLTDLGRHSPLERGMVLQRAWLAAHAQSLSFHPVSSPVFFMERIQKENDLEGLFRESVEHAANSIRKYFRLNTEEHPVFLFRVSYSDEPTARALRRSIDSCFHANKPKV